MLNMFWSSLCTVPAFVDYVLSIKRNLICGRIILTIPFCTLNFERGEWLEFELKSFIGYRKSEYLDILQRQELPRIVGGWSLVASERPYLDGGSLTILVHAFVILRLDYCNALYVGLPLRLMWKLQMVQNVAARLLSGMRRHQHISPILAALHWLPIRFHIDFNVLTMTYKTLNGLGP